MTRHLLQGAPMSKTQTAVPRVLPIVALMLACNPSLEDAHVSQTSTPILGGTAAGEGDFPTVVALLFDMGRRGLCTGTLVAPDLILTAAHCVSTQVTQYPTQDEVTANTLAIIDGTNLLAGTGTVVAVSATIPHPGFGSPGDPDVGLVRLSQPLTDRVPTPLNLVAADAPIGTNVTMVGYGLSEPGNQMSAGTAMVLDSKSSVACTNGVSDSTFLCWDQTDGTGKCSGDSGGPSFASINGVEKVVGITSFGDQDCGVFGADMRVDASREFLAENAPELLCGADGNCEASCPAGMDPDCAAGCTEDNDCPNTGEVCDTNVGQCVAGPGSPGGLGSPCDNGQAMCVAGTMCGNSPDGDSVCTRPCSSDDCPSGFDCVTDDTGAGACFEAAAGGGCNAGGSGSIPGAILALLVLGFLSVRKRLTQPS